MFNFCKRQNYIQKQKILHLIAWGKNEDSRKQIKLNEERYVGKLNVF